MSKQSIFCWGMFAGCFLTIAVVECVDVYFSSPSGPGQSQTVIPTESDTPALIDYSPSEPGAEVSPMEAPAQYILMNVSAYCPCEKCCGKWADGFTASGRPAVGRICAAPPEYPFGTVLEVEGYGEYVVQDRGGAIKGNKLDLLFPTHQAALEFGRKTLKVRIK